MNSFYNFLKLISFLDVTIGHEVEEEKATTETHHPDHQSDDKKDEEEDEEDGDKKDPKDDSDEDDEVFDNPFGT